MNAEAIRNLRAALDMTQQEFAVAAGVSVGTVHRWESGVSKPSPLALDKLRELKKQLDSSQTVLT